jgi:hypothetical protein
LLVGKNGRLKDIRSHDPTGGAKGLLSDLLLVDSNPCHNLPLLAHRTSIFAWPPLARLLGMNHKRRVKVEPDGFLLQFSLCCSTGVGFASKAPNSQMPTLLLPGGLGFAHLSL